MKPDPRMEGAEHVNTPTVFVCGHGSFPNPCGICQGTFHNAICDPIVLPHAPEPKIYTAAQAGKLWIVAGFLGFFSGAAVMLLIMEAIR